MGKTFLQKTLLGPGMKRDNTVKIWG
ncbi:hypothetical protein Ocin01_16958 [Orchesella cincta]|uniref:Uncharacterized protein n=1 Tax=Orchesella cincta TaxID=48709 RepID=A0A1D2MA08_ORCCI|nr:hypothetical protein Ocin01_16958 [Orchesella cincta]